MKEGTKVCCILVSAREGKERQAPFLHGDEVGTDDDVEFCERSVRRDSNRLS